MAEAHLPVGAAHRHAAHAHGQDVARAAAGLHQHLGGERVQLVQQRGRVAPAQHQVLYVHHRPAQERVLRDLPVHIPREHEVRRRAVVVADQAVKVEHQRAPDRPVVADQAQDPPRAQALLRRAHAEVDRLLLHKDLPNPLLRPRKIPLRIGSLEVFQQLHQVVHRVSPPFSNTSCLYLSIAEAMGSARSAAASAQAQSSRPAISSRAPGKRRA